MSILIISEKPKVSQKIAYAISKNYKRRRKGRTSYYQLSKDGETIFVASAAGHLYSLKEKEPSRSYPVFDVEWAPLYEIEKSKGYTRQYIELLNELGSRAELFIIATDYDIEGELLGYNALRFAVLENGKAEEAKVKRMHFSTLTPIELKKAYSDPVQVDLALVKAGESRHILDWYWGINVSRALTSAAKKALRRRAIFSAGRVQTPALAILVRREREIESFEPELYKKIYAELKVSRRKLRGEHHLGRIFDLGKAEAILKKVEWEKKATVEEVHRKESRVPPPVPFDLGTLQSEAYKLFRLSPKRTQEVAQSLYEGGYISYPRTSSQKLPPSIGYRRIIKALGKGEGFKELSNKLLQKERLYPRQGKKEDPAHPAIYPTGTRPRKLGGQERKLYELVVHRFFALFGDAMLREKVDVSVDIGGERFKFSAGSTLEEGWKEFYPYLKLEEVRLPELKRGDVLRVLKIYDERKQTSPPKRYNPATLVKELEKLGMGTKATRADVVETLYRRDYIKGVAIKVTPLGMRVIEALEQSIPKIIDEKLTRHFEEKLEEIRQGRATVEETLAEARRELTSTLKDFGERKETIGKSLARGYIEKDREKNIVGRCPNCTGELRVIRSRNSKKKFIGCSSYPECKTSFPLPQKRNIYPTDKTCNLCGLPMVSVPLGKRRVLSCIDMNCKSKEKFKKRSTTKQ